MNAGFVDAGAADAGPLVCGIGSCAGCCLGSVCYDGLDAGRCGLMGQLCMPCPSGSRCDSGRCVFTTSHPPPMGSSCSSDLGCADAGEVRCKLDFPGGYCTVENCGTARRCDDYSVCDNREQPPLCLAKCGVDAGNCRQGYRCRPFVDGGSTGGCIP